MPVTKVQENNGMVEVTFSVKLDGSMLDMEEALQESLNEAGCAVMEKALESFDTDGSPIKIADTRFSCKGRFKQAYETPYGKAHVERYIYQTSKGGRTFCPLEHNANLALNSTPRYAKIVAGKYSRMGADTLRRDLLECNGREISRDYVMTLGNFIGALAQAKDATWEYELPEFDKPVAAISIGLDGTCMLMREGDWREAMCGSIALYDSQGERLHTIYAGASPEYGKGIFLERFEREVDRVKAKYPDAIYLGLADGAKVNWDFLTPRTDRQTLDFYHAREYVAQAAGAICGHGTKRDEWEEQQSHRLKHVRGAAKKLLDEMKESLPKIKGWQKQDDLRKAITYFENHRAKMQYWKNVDDGLPIGSGVTEAACKILIKQRMCISGSRWKDEGAAAVIALRSLELTPGRWEQFWKYANQFGIK